MPSGNANLGQEKWIHPQGAKSASKDVKLDKLTGGMRGKRMGVKVK